INDLKKCGYKKDNRELNYKFLNNLQPEWKQYGTLMRQTKNLIDINIDALYNILKQNQGDVNDALGYKKKAVMITSDPLALVAEKTKVSKRNEKAKVQTESEGSDDEDTSDLKKITALLAKAFNRKKYYAKPTNNNLRTSSASSSTNKKLESRNFHDAIESASENFIENHIDSQKDYDKSEVDHNDSEEKDHLFNKLIRKFNHKIAKCQKQDLRPILYDEKVIGLGYTLMFLTHSDEALEIDKFKRARENKIEFAYDYGNLLDGSTGELIGIGPVNVFTSKEILKHNGGVAVSKGAKKLLNAVIRVTTYFTWKNRNMRVFKGKGKRITSIFKEIQLRSFEWSCRDLRNICFDGNSD
nr:RNA-directed DNA polymerase, eukaryota, reverse transcriptase zinc-binding domain protein [Tanacetum cinerariifolium]